MRILALNCGSSSIKAAVFAGASFERTLEARAEHVGSPSPTLHVAHRNISLDPLADLPAAAAALLNEVRSQLSGGEDITAVVHRVVHGGERFTEPTQVDDRVLADLDLLSALAPLHNPPALAVIRAARRLFASIPHFAVFDTAFHATLPPPAREYALPRTLRAQRSLRRFGFHGISHADLARRVAARCGVAPEALRIVSCHLGNGASIAAIEHGRSVETSMGMTPLEGLVMGTRAGDLDPGLVLELMRTHDRDALERMLTHECGLRGLTGTNDMREIERRAAQEDEQCRLALAMYTHRVCKYIGAYAATMGGIDALAFTGGVGENSSLVRERCVARLEFLGVRLDRQRNQDALNDEDCDELSAQGSGVRVFALRAAEERAMAQAIAPLLKGVG